MERVIEKPEVNEKGKEMWEESWRKEKDWNRRAEKEKMKERR